jgi:hypothetical protein
MVNHSQLLQQEPENVADNGYGGKHIPIEPLENTLDQFQWGTQNYQWNLYKDGYANLCVGASIELVLNLKTDEGENIKRTFVGSCNFTFQSIAPITDWNATAKSMCIKNAATDAGKYLGRGINSEILPDRTAQQDKSKNEVRKKPDSKIMQKFLKAVEDKDEATITMLSNIYDLKTNENVESIQE